MKFLDAIGKVAIFQKQAEMRLPTCQIVVAKTLVSANTLNASTLESGLLVPTHYRCPCNVPFYFVFY